MKGLYEAGGDFDVQHNYKHEQHCLALRATWDVLQHPFFPSSVLKLMGAHCNSGSFVLLAW